MPLSTKQMEYLALAWQCFETEPKIDYEKFKSVAGLASAHSARELMRVTKNKLKTEYGALSGVQAANGTGTPSKTPTPSKAGTPASVVSKTTTPGSRKRGRPAGKKSKAEMEEANANGGDEESSSAADVENETPTKKAKMTNGVKVEKGEDEFLFGDDGLFQ